MFKKIISNLLGKLGYKISKKGNADLIIKNDGNFENIYAKCKDFTMTSKERMYSVYKSVEYIVKNDIPGDFVECGVWKGGNTMLIAYLLLHFNIKNRKIYLYDTFEGMSEPTDDDVSVHNKKFSVKDKWSKVNNSEYNDWCYSPLPEVKGNMELTNYPQENIVYVKGKVEDTIPKNMPEKISLLRLDTDWYESTKHELIHLYPLLVKNGVLLIDDYGCWEGSKKAVDEYFKEKPILLNRIDRAGRTGVKI